jgi:hypothetical protein
MLRLVCFQEISASKLGQETVTAKVVRGFLHCMVDDSWQPFKLLCLHDHCITWRRISQLIMDREINPKLGK